MSKAALHRTLIIVVGFAVVAIGMAIAIGGGAEPGPLVGETTHDFGTLIIEGESASAKHIFTLTNATDDTLTIRGVRPSCGCTAATPSRLRILPQTTVEIHTAFLLKNSGEKSAELDVIFEGGRRQTLHVRGIGRRLNPLTTDAQGVAVAPDAEVPVTIFYEQHTDAGPPAPAQIDAPRQVRATFTDWTLAAEGRRERHAPARWRGSVMLKQVDEPLPDNAAIDIRVPDGSGEAQLTLAVQSATDGRGHVLLSPPNAGPGTAPRPTIPADPTDEGPVPVPTSDEGEDDGASDGGDAGGD